MVDDEIAPSPPTVDELQAIPDRSWVAVLPLLRASLRALPDDALTPQVRRLRAVPPKRLRSGRVRHDLCLALAEGGALWVGLRRQLTEQPELAAQWKEALTAPSEEPSQGSGTPTPTRDDDTGRVARLKERARSLKEQRDDFARRVDGAEARATAAEDARAEADGEVRALREQVEALRRERDTAAAASADDVERERRRSARDQQRLREELREARRTIEELQSERDRLRVALTDATADRSPATPTAVEPDDEPDGFEAGRPTRVPSSIHPETTEYAMALLPRGRLVIVDGYNVTRTHRAALSLDDQRSWLIGLASAAASRFGLRIILVFDGADGTGLSRTRSRGVQVEFTRDGLSADDDIVFQVAALPPDEPVTVVTDDGELRRRLAEYHVDHLFTRQLLWAAG